MRFSFSVPETKVIDGGSWLLHSKWKKIILNFKKLCTVLVRKGAKSDSFANHFGCPELYRSSKNFIFVHNLTGTTVAHFITSGIPI